MQVKLTLFFVLLSMQSLFGQICIPNPFYQDSTGIFPKPEQAEIPGSGITGKVCIGIPYKYDFTVRIPDTIIYLGFPVVISKAYLPANAIAGLPAGITYACSPDNCEFAVDELHCISLLGTAEPQVVPGEYPLVISLKVVTGFGTLDLKFPDPGLAPGEYILRVEEASSTYCQSLSAHDPKVANDLLVVPNPASDRLNIEFSLEQAEIISWKLISISGEIMEQANLKAISGKNQMNLDISKFPSGIAYFQLITNKSVQGSSIQIIH